jgi:uncharacterized protein YndB with AHSA1/START domain
MTTQDRTDSSAAALEVRKRVEVPLAPDAAFELFTTRMTEFWPAEHSIGDSAFAEVVVEPMAGGRWFERAADGSECRWGGVAEWDPPSRLVLEWQVGASWAYDPDLHTFVEVTFTPLEGGTTRVELRHHGLESYGDQADQMRAVYADPAGWQGTLDNLAELVRRDAG